MADSIDVHPWAEGAEEFRGQRLLPHVIDYHAHHDPDRVFAAIPNTETIVDGFRDVTMKTMATMIDHMAWWLDRTLKASSKSQTLAYIGASDLRYTIVFCAAIKCGWRTFFISTENPVILSLGLLQQADVSALLHADAMRSTAKALQKFDPSMKCKQVPSMAELLRSESAPYIFDGKFACLKDQHTLLLHSSGSTAPPKLVMLTHSALSCTDNDPRVPVPEGRKAQNAAQFNFSPPAKFYAAFSPYSMAGAHSYMLLPAFSQTAAVVLGPSNMLPSGDLLSSVMKQQDIRAIYLPPSIIEQWAKYSTAYEQAKNLDFILYGGGPLATAVGDKLNKITDVCQTFGSLDMGHIQMLVPQPGDWAYIEPNPIEECDMQEVDEGVFEMVLHCDEKFRGQRSLEHNYPDVTEWRTKDLFVPHPEKPGLWRFHSHTNDIIVLASGDKVWPIPMESTLVGNPNINGALMVGNHRAEVLLLVEPNPGPQVDRMSKKEFLDSIWPTIALANASAPDYGKIRRSRILLSQPNLPFFKTSRGTIARKPTESLYAECISAAFMDGTTDEESEIGILERHWVDEAKRFIGSILHDIRPDVQLKETDDFFVAKAMDSLTVLELGQKLRLSLSSRIDKEQNTINFWVRTIFGNPTIDSLAKATLDAFYVHGGSVSDSRASSKNVEFLLEEMISQLPEPTSKEPCLPFPTKEIKIVLIGSRGRVAPFLVKDLLDNPRVSVIKCLDHSAQADSETSPFRTDDMGLDVNSSDPRLQFFTVEFSQPNLNLSHKELDEIFSDVDVIIHNMWTLNFSISLISFKPVMLQGLLSVIDIANCAPSQPRLVFISSITTIDSWAQAVSPNVPVPEEVVNCAAAAKWNGYSQSKHIAERLLAAAGAKLQIPISIIRIGTVAGPSKITEEVKWKSCDWMHSIAILSKACGLIPVHTDSIDWIHVDQASRVIEEISLQEKHDYPTGTPNVQLYNLIHPQPLDWSAFSNALQGCISSSQQVGFQEWVDHLGSLLPNNLSKEAEDEKIRILPFFKSVAQRNLAKCDLRKSKAASPTMAAMEPLDEQLLIQWCQDWTA
ncbi:hypothetical protein N7495_000127 [Penicillium taxi]|uniref:uncharacterized protein n=1 Tax=Penicillium taxi TaxID=168475 RepID=UPI0025458219|nr:uncharacterized protein N7495_000127 [Penicillium taxi]KAJ5907445.1 hypothetical protein N7495_000127 [Penicillium taxi]